MIYLLLVGVKNGFYENILYFQEKIGEISVMPQGLSSSFVRLNIHFNMWCWWLPKGCNRPHSWIKLVELSKPIESFIQE